MALVAIAAAAWLTGPHDAQIKKLYPKTTPQQLMCYMNAWCSAYYAVYMFVLSRASQPPRRLGAAARAYCTAVMRIALPSFRFRLRGARLLLRASRIGVAGAVVLHLWRGWPGAGCSHAQGHVSY